MKNILALCATPYQLLVVNQIAEQFYGEDDFSVVVLDTMANAETVYTRLQKESRFKKVYFWKVKDRFKFNKLQKLCNRLFGFAASKRIMSKYDGLDEKYDVLLYANNSKIVMHTGTVLLHTNKNLSVELFEDGFSTYSEHVGNAFSANGLISKIRRRFFLKTSKLYLFNPQILVWKPNFPVLHLDTHFSANYLARINRVFDYESLEDNYGKKVIFFEESYAADGKEIDDTELLGEIASIVGKENIMVKIHPRNPENRFEKLGYETNRNISIPWEVIVLNCNFNDSMFVTIASNAAMNPYFLFGKTTPAILLYKCTEKPESLYKSLIKFDDELCSRHPEIFSIPSNTDEMKSTIKRILKEIG